MKPFSYVSPRNEKEAIGALSAEPDKVMPLAGGQDLLAGMSDIPKIDVRLVDQSERGVIGIGEPPTVPTAAAIANAVRNAIGVTVRSLPLTPAKILQTLAARRT